MDKVQRQIAYNRSVRNAAIRYIVVHDTGNTGTGADAMAHFHYFNGGNRGSSADIFVDDHSVWQVNDYARYYAWHCGDGKGKYGITNANSVGVEMCINADGDYDAALRNTARVVRELMQELSIPIGRVVRHWDASRKNCPASMSGSGWARWNQFKEMLKEEELTMSQYEALMAEIQGLKEQLDKLANPMIYNYIDENMPAWARDAVRWAVDNSIVRGDGNGLALTDEKLWQLVVLKRFADTMQK